jgi:hypothetical protein
MAHYNQNQKEVTKRGTSAQRRPLRDLRSIPFGNPGPNDRNHRNRHQQADLVKAYFEQPGTDPSTGRCTLGPRPRGRAGPA